jgi:allophanate hydrolase
MAARRVTLIGPAGSDHLLAEAGARLQQQLGGAAQADAIAATPLPFNESTIKVCVVGAHLAGQPLNWQLLEAGARRVAVTRTAAHYRLYALAGTTPPKPGLAHRRRRRRHRGGSVGNAAAPVRWLRRRHPGAAGHRHGGAGRWQQRQGFICEPAGIAGATDITHHGGWVNYLNSLH